MKIYAIKDISYKNELAYLIYFPRWDRFYIEIPDNADPWEMPLILSNFAEKRIYTIDSYWSRIWVQQRIIPPDRQNIGQILKGLKLRRYDEFKLLISADGKCAQDDCYIQKIKEEDITKWLKERKERKLKDIMATENKGMIAFFNNGETKACRIGKILENDIRFRPVLKDENLYFHVSMQPGGYGIQWGESLGILSEELYDIGKSITLSIEDLKRYIKFRTIDTAEAKEYTGFSRQYLQELVDKNNLLPVKEGKRNRLYMKSCFEI